MAAYDTPEAVLATETAHPEFSEFVATANREENPFPFMAFSDIAAFSNSLPHPAPSPTADIEYVIEIPMRDGFINTARVFRPTSTSLDNPLVVMIHGGGFICGHSHDVNIYGRSLAKLYNVTVVSLDHRLAPQHKFPVLPQDVWDSVNWLVESTNAQSVGADPTVGFVLGGISAGGNLTSVTTCRWVSEKLSPPITGLWQSVAYFGEKESVPEKYHHLWLAREQNADALIINKAALDHALKMYEPDFRSPLFSPFNHPASTHIAHPPTYFQVTGQDPCRDDGLIYEKVLRENGAKTKIDVYQGVPHGYDQITPQLKYAHKFQMDTLTGFGWLLGKSASNEEKSKALANAFALEAGTS